MIKTKEKGGMFGKTLAAACSLALVASLTPAAALTAFAAPATQDAPTRIKVTVEQLDDQGKATKTIVKNLDAAGVTAALTPVTVDNASAIYYNNGTWGVATAKSGKAATITDFVKAAVGTDWTWPVDDVVKKQNPKVEIKSGYKDPAAYGAYPEGVISQFVQSVSTDWSTLVDSTNFYEGVTNTGFNGDFTASGTKTGAYIVADGQSVFNAIGTKQNGDSLTAQDVAGTNGSVATPFATGYAFITGLTQNNAVNHAEKYAAQMVQGVNEIKVTFDYSGLDNIDRIAGTNWDNTMADIVDETVALGTGADTATKYQDVFDATDTFVIATANGYEDALAASGFAGLMGCPLLMTDRNELTQETINVINEYRTTPTAPLTIYLIGGNMVVSDNVMTQLEELAGVSNTSTGSVERIAGANSWDTALALYERGIELGKAWGKGNANGTTEANEIIVATSIDYQDALSISPYAYANKLPVILTTNDAVLSEDVAEAIQDNIKTTVAANKIAQATFVGGTVVVSPVVSEQLLNIPIKRLAGTTAYDTSAAVAKYLKDDVTAFGAATTAGIATGLDYLDALSSCNYTGTQKVVLLLADESNETTITGFLTDNGPQGDPAGTYTSAVIFGGTAVVSQQVAIDANNALID